MLEKNLPICINYQGKYKNDIAVKSSDKHLQCKLYTPQCSNHGFLSQAS